MSGSTAAVWTIPFVVGAALFGWLFAVLWANRHPGRSHETPLSTEVRGGSFRAVEGGRQLMPIPERKPADVPGPRAATASESLRHDQERPAEETAREAAQAERTARERVSHR